MANYTNIEEYLLDIYLSKVKNFRVKVSGNTIYTNQVGLVVGKNGNKIKELNKIFNSQFIVKMYYEANGKVI